MGKVLCSLTGCVHHTVVLLLNIVNTIDSCRVQIWSYHLQTTQQLFLDSKSAQGSSSKVPSAGGDAAASPQTTTNKQTNKIS